VGEEKRRLFLNEMVIQCFMWCVCSECNALMSYAMLIRCICSVESRNVYVAFPGVLCYAVHMPLQ
jgi:hypothetical protein